MVPEEGRSGLGGGGGGGGCGIFSCLGFHEGGGEYYNVDGNNANADDNTIAIDSLDARFVLDHVEEDNDRIVLWSSSLVDEIDDVENALSLMKSKKDEKNVMIKVSKMKSHLVGSSAEDEEKEVGGGWSGYYRTLLRAAVLNARMESRRAQFELRRIELESMRVERELECIMEASLNDDDDGWSGVASDESDDDGSFFGVFGKMARHYDRTASVGSTMMEAGGRRRGSEQRKARAMTTSKP